MVTDERYTTGSIGKLLGNNYRMTIQTG